MKLFLLTATVILSMFSVNALGQNATITPVANKASLSAADKKTVTDFEKRLQRYVSDRQAFEQTVPMPPKEATPEQIAAHKITLQKAVQGWRVNAKQGDIFTQQIALLMKEMIRKEFVGWEASELRKAVLEADTKGVPVKVNAPYPDSKELIEMPPPLLLTLPQLPKQLRYRFIGRNLALLDRDNALILDFITNALP